MNQKTHTKIILRKFLHLGTLIPFSFFWYLYYVLDMPDTANLFLLAILIAYFIYEYFRLDLMISVPFDTLIKPKEQNSTVDGMNLIIAGLIVHTIFPFSIALTAMLMGIIGDTCSTIGGLLGKKRIFPNSDIKTTWEGAIFTLIANIIIGLSVLGFSSIVVIMALSAIIIETMLIRLDDNLIVPIAISTIALISQYVF